MVVGVSASRGSGQCLIAGHVEDAVHDLVVDPVAADRDDQRPPRRRGIAGQLTGMAGVYWVASNATGTSGSRRPSSLRIDSANVNGTRRFTGF